MALKVLFGGGKVPNSTGLENNWEKSGFLFLATMEKLQKGDKKLLNAWAFYDWANSVYTLTIASSIFPIFYSALFSSDEALVSALCFEMKPTVLIEIVTAFSLLLIPVVMVRLVGRLWRPLISRSASSPSR